MTISEPPSYDLYQIAEAGFSTNNYIYLGTDYNLFDKIKKTGFVFLQKLKEMI